MPARRKGNLPAGVRATIDGTGRRFGTVDIVTLAVFYVPELSPKGPGPWTGEADKIAWIDPVTGMNCIIRRSIQGHLCGYVAVEADHPLYGCEADGLPFDPELKVHGRVSYAQACEHLRPIAKSVWRKPPTADAGTAWWLGFECNLASDDLPGRPSRLTGDEHAPSFRDHRDGDVPIPVYRSEAYVYHGCVSLAAQLDAIADGAPKLVVSSIPEPEADR